MLTLQIDKMRLPKSDNAKLILLLLIAFVIISSGLGCRDPWSPDEPRFALIAQEMVDTGTWFFPHRGGQLYPDKPPLFMWIVAAFYLITGSIAVATLLPSLCAGLICIGLIYDLGRRLWNPTIGMIAGLVLLTTLQFVMQTKTGQIDALLCLWTTLAMYGLVRHLVLGPAWHWYYIACIAMGLGVITKAVGFLPLFLLGIYAFGRFRQWRYLAPIEMDWKRWFVGPALTLGIIGLWLVPMLIQVELSNDSALLTYRNNILFKQTMQRYANAWDHQKPFWFFIGYVIPFFWLPVTLAFPWLFGAWWQRLKKSDGRFLLLLGWIAIVVIFFSYASGKRHLYVLPAVPFLALVTAPFMSKLIKVRPLHFLHFSVTLMAGCAALGTALFFSVFAPEKGQMVVAKYHVAPWLFLAVIGCIGIALSLTLRPRRGIFSFAAFIFCFWLLYGWWGYPLFNPGKSARAFMANIGNTIGPDAELALVDWKEQFILFADRPVVNFGYIRSDRLQESKEAMHWMLQGKNRWVLTRKRYLQPCIDPKRALDLGIQHRRHWFLINRQAMVNTPGPDCGLLMKNKPR